MSVVWSAMAVEPDWFSGLERHSAVENLADQLNELRTLGQGYVEVRLPGGDLPYLTLGFQGDHAIIHLFDDSGGLPLLVGDGTAAPEAGAGAGAMIMSELAMFTGDFTLSLDHSWDILCNSIQA
ncbi:hypothetical protein ADL00_16300 [Streptomyces sp. AS58]|uniref:hypothetical protein n=1 Tax=Streptomyces sp. AS58 TaxID=1519489 RepID=UPI0006AE1B07|nr:hypothetical protein [Streptomyces sp. AS58]KOV67350.1 hypothetical protein ADL00_16300 [Streptomyces sp. AS58]